jgi:hypothetical protein
MNKMKEVLQCRKKQSHREIYLSDPKYLSDEDKSLIEFEVALIGKMIHLRNEKKMTQKDLAEAAGL